MQLASRPLALAFLFTISECALAETYNDCILENMKGVGGDVAARLVRKACQDKVLAYVPKKCNEMQRVEFERLKKIGRNPFEAFDSNSPAYQGCINSCLNAGYWSKTFGGCKR